MKIIKTILLLGAFVALLGIASNIISAGQVSFKLVKEVQESNSEKVMVYQLLDDNGEFDELKVFVKNQNGLQIIKVGSPDPNMETEYVYNTLGAKPNFMNILYNYEETVNSLREATDLAVSHYLKYH